MFAYILLNCFLLFSYPTMELDIIQLLYIIAEGYEYIFYGNLLSILTLTKLDEKEKYKISKNVMEPFMFQMIKKPFFKSIHNI